MSYDGEWKDGQRLEEGRANKRDSSSYEENGWIKPMALANLLIPINIFTQVKWNMVLDKDLVNYAAVMEASPS